MYKYINYYFVIVQKLEETKYIKLHQKIFNHCTPNVTLQRPQWFPLLNSKYQRLKPEIQVMLNLEDDSLKKPEQISPPQHSTPSRKGQLPLLCENLCISYP
jgi:hypothetical protein